MAASKMAAWSLKWLYYLNYYSTKKYDVLVLKSVTLPSVIYYLIFTNSRWRHPIWRYPRWRSIFVLRPSATLFPYYSLDQPLLLKVTKIILDPVSHLESIVVVIGGIHTSLNLLLSDWYTNGWHRTKLAF